MKSREMKKRLCGEDNERKRRRVGGKTVSSVGTYVSKLLRFPETEPN